MGRRGGRRGRANRRPSLIWENWGGRRGTNKGRRRGSRAPRGGAACRGRPGEGRGTEAYLVASALEGVAAQRLVRVLCPKCREADRQGVEEVRARFGARSREGTYYLGRGCEFCNYTGYRGRVAIFEIAEMDDELRHLVINRAPHHTLKEQAVGAGMTTLLDDGLEKAAAGLTSLAEAWRGGSVERANHNR